MEMMLRLENKDFDPYFEEDLQIDELEWFSNKINLIESLYSDFKRMGLTRIPPNLTNIAPIVKRYNRTLVKFNS
jgi:hypothetical protein